MKAFWRGISVCENRKHLYAVFKREGTAQTTFLGPTNSKRGPMPRRLHLGAPYAATPTSSRMPVAYWRKTSCATSTSTSSKLHRDHAIGAKVLPAEGKLICDILLADVSLDSAESRRRLLTRGWVLQWGEAIHPTKTQWIDVTTSAKMLTPRSKYRVPCCLSGQL